MKNFYQYLAESTREFSYKIRTVFPLDEVAMLKVNRILARYSPISIIQNRTLLHTDPVDFPSVAMAEVYILDILTAIPASSMILQDELRGALNIPAEYIVVRGINEPLELEVELMNSPLPDSPLLGTDYPASDEPQAFGDEYNQRLLDYLAKVAATRKTIDPLIEPQNQDRTKLFSFLNTEVSDLYNDDRPGVKPVHRNHAKLKALPPAKVAPTGNFQDADRIQLLKKNKD
jgi:hypothetical protein